ncbi:MAG: hypothetical protein SVP26_10955 [Chloroflexota bacterium]|nr:hypothetical protein [Chloroflexota bacterium]
MADGTRRLADPLEQLLQLLDNEHVAPVELAQALVTADALVRDLRGKMTAEIRHKWQVRINELRSACRAGTYAMAEEMAGLCDPTVAALQGRFAELVEEDHVQAARHYEQAATALESMSQGLSSALAMAVQKEAQPDEGLRPKRVEELMKVVWVTPSVGLWDLAGDAYARASCRIAEARKCYERGIEVLESCDRLHGDEQARKGAMAHLLLSLARALLQDPERWHQAEELYRRVADMVFFSAEQRDNQQYMDIYSLVDDVLEFDVRFDRPDWLPHVSCSEHPENRERLVKLQAELGRRALDVLSKEFETSEEGFPVPETFYLVAGTSKQYMHLKEYRSCLSLVEQNASFDGAFFDWAWDELSGTLEWAFAFILYLTDMAEARAMLERPDYSEFLKEVRGFKELQHRVELRQIRTEKVQRASKTLLEHVDSSLQRLSLARSVERTQSRLLDEKPWLKDCANFGSIVNAETLYEQLQVRNYAEIVVGLCNAVEAELKECLYKRYLDFLAQSPNERYGEESRRQGERGSVLYFFASMVGKYGQFPAWKRCVSTAFPDQEQFLLFDLPRSLRKLTDLRNPSAHGKMSSAAKAKRTRELVLGSDQTPGLLQRLAELRGSQDAP